MSGLIERLRTGAMDPTTWNLVTDEAADALEALKGYAEHYLTCASYDNVRCDCGLSDLLIKVMGD